MLNLMGALAHYITAPGAAAESFQPDVRAGAPRDRPGGRRANHGSYRCPKHIETVPPLGQLPSGREPGRSLHGELPNRGGAQRGSALHPRALEIVERLEFEMMHLASDTTISRTSSGFAIDERPSPELNVEAVLALVDKIVASGYLKVEQEHTERLTG